MGRWSSSSAGECGGGLNQRWSESLVGAAQVVEQRAAGIYHPRLSLHSLAAFLNASTVATIRL